MVSHVIAFFQGGSELERLVSTFSVALPCNNLKGALPLKQGAKGKWEVRWLSRPGTKNSPQPQLCSELGAVFKL